MRLFVADQNYFNFPSNYEIRTGKGMSRTPQPSGSAAKSSVAE